VPLVEDGPLSVRCVRSARVSARADTARTLAPSLRRHREPRLADHGSLTAYLGVNFITVPVTAVFVSVQ
jgi:hypothetical protein